jgi:Flp pilus assembly protein TadG
MVSALGRSLHRFWRRFVNRAGEVGQAVVEMAIVLPILVLLLGGTIEVGDVINSYLTVIDVSRDSARLGSKGAATDTEIRDMASREMERLRDPFDPNADMTIVHETFDGNTSIRIEVCSDHGLLLPGLSLFLNPLRMCSTTRMRTLTFG